LTRPGGIGLILLVGCIPVLCHGQGADIEFISMTSAHSAALHPLTGLNSRLVLDHLSLDVLIDEPMKAHVTCTYRIHNPAQFWVNETFLLPLTVSMASFSSIKEYYCWLFGGMDLQLNQTYLEMNISSNGTPVKFVQSQEDDLLDEFLMRYPTYNLSRRQSQQRSGGFIPVSFNLSLPPLSRVNVSTSYYQPYLLYPDPGLETNMTIQNISSLRGLFAHLTGSIGLWTNRTDIDTRYTIQSDLFHASEKNFTIQNDGYVYEERIDDWNPISEPVTALEWVPWEASHTYDQLPERYRRIFEPPMNQTFPTDLPWETYIPGKIEFVGPGVSLEEETILIEAQVKGAEGYCLVPMLQYETRSKYGGGGGGASPRRREGNNFSWTVSIWSEVSAFNYQICIWNNDSWTLSPIQFHDYPSLEALEPTLDVELWVEEHRPGEVPSLIYKLPPNLTEPQCTYRFLGRGIPGIASGSMEPLGEDIYRFSIE
jgi:hypothetical protein